MAVGNVKWFDPRKGFGFIIGQENEDIFVHFSVIQSDGYRSLRDGEPVEYEVERSDKGLLAKSVRRLAPTRSPQKVGTPA
jgi:CspA family cold shock protein